MPGQQPAVAAAPLEPCLSRTGPSLDSRRRQRSAPSRNRSFVRWSPRQRRRSGNSACPQRERRGQPLSRRHGDPMRKHVDGNAPRAPVLNSLPYAERYARAAAAIGIELADGAVAIAGAGRAARRADGTAESAGGGDIRGERARAAGAGTGELRRPARNGAAAVGEAGLPGPAATDQHPAAAIGKTGAALAGVVRARLLRAAANARRPPPPQVSWPLQPYVTVPLQPYVTVPPQPLSKAPHWPG